MADLDLTSLRLFVLVCDSGSIARAASQTRIRIDLEERVSPEILRGVQEGVASLGVCWDTAPIGNLK